MAASAAAITGVKRQTAGQLFSVVRRVTFDDSYVTGGEPVTAASFGLSRIVRIGNTTLRAGFASGFAHVDPLIQTDGSLLVRLRAAAGTQVSNGADASTVVADITVEGF